MEEYRKELMERYGDRLMEKYEKSRHRSMGDKEDIDREDVDEEDLDGESTGKESIDKESVSEEIGEEVSVTSEAGRGEEAGKKKWDISLLMGILAVIGLLVMIFL